MAKQEHLDEIIKNQRRNFVASGIGVLVLSAFLSPADGGMMLNHWMIVIVISHVVFYLLHFLRTPYDPNSLLTKLTVPHTCCIVTIVSIVVTTIGLMHGIIPVYFGLANA